MAHEIILEKGEVRTLGPRRYSAITPLVARTDDLTGSGEELLLITPGKNGLRILPYGSVFLGYEPLSEEPVFETPDGLETEWHLDDDQKADRKQAREDAAVELQRQGNDQGGSNP